MNILNRDDLERGGFAGLKETRLVMDPRLFNGRAEPDTWAGIGDFVYLADASFQPRGETGLHSHKEIDVISVMVEGRIGHEGSLEHGRELTGHNIQVQRAGGEGFAHNEVNPDSAENRMIQLWVLPERPGEPAGYKLYETDWGQTARVYGGATGQSDTYASETKIDVSLMRRDQTMTASGECLAYLTKGSGTANGAPIREGSLIRSDGFVFEAAEDVQLILVHLGS